MTTYWISFRVDDDPNYDNRYALLNEAIIALSRNVWWADTTSFYLIDSGHDVGQIASSLRGVLGQNDLALVGSMDHQGATLIGESDDLSSLRRLVPLLREV